MHASIQPTGRRVSVFGPDERTQRAHLINVETKPHGPGRRRSEQIVGAQHPTSAAIAPTNAL